MEMNNGMKMVVYLEVNSMKMVVYLEVNSNLSHWFRLGV
jgi:hypothetical protein